MKSLPPTQLFVYGTLRRDSRHELYHLLAKNARFVGEGAAPGKLFDLGEYPGMIPDRSGRVLGELYQIDHERWPDVIARLDEYEGCGSGDPPPHEYRRELIDVLLHNGEATQAWAYILNERPPKVREIVSGDYMAWRDSF